MSEGNNYYNDNDNEDQELKYVQAPDNGGSNPNNDYYNQNNYNNDKGSENGFGIAAMILGIIAIPVSCCAIVFAPLSFILSIVAIVLAIVQIVKYQKRGMAIAGIICSVLAIILTVLLLLLRTFVVEMFDTNNNGVLEIEEIEQFNYDNQNLDDDLFDDL
jgi:hypothetical protein